MGVCLALSSALLAQTRSSTPAATSAEPTPLDQAENAVRLMAQGNYRGASQAAKQALQAAPDEATLHLLAAVLFMNTGDWRSANTAFHTAARYEPDDSLALYGQGLAELGQGHRAEALKALQRAEAHGADPAYVLVARRYTQWLEGAQIAVEGAAVPDTLVAAQNALMGMSAVRQRDWNRAAKSLMAAQDALVGDPVLQPGGLLMTFDPVIALDTSAPPLPSENGLLPPPSQQGALSGDIPFTPEGSNLSVGFVEYEIDGRTLGFVNTPPYQFVWDSRQVANGRHLLNVVLYDRQGQEITQIHRSVRIYNAGHGALEALSPGRLAQLRSEFWQALALQPDRAACAYSTGTVYRAMGDMQAAREWFARAAAAQPDYQDTRLQWLACGGSGHAGEALWGGLRTEKVIALTFDDGPRPGITDSLLDMLTQQGVVGTFFVVGKNVAKYPDLTRKITAAGMEIANHSYTHRNLTKLSADAVAGELMQTQSIVKMVTGKSPRFVRPPGGNWNGAVAEVARKWGLTPCMWTVDVYGSEVIGAQQVADAVLAQVRPGSIVLMHNGKLSTMQALPTIIRELRRQGYSFVTVDTLERRLSAAKEAARQAARWSGNAPHAE